ncbi:MAG: VOC family protein [Cyanobacteria bacterium P01_C01_bin.120]
MTETNSPRCLSITPIIPVSDIGRALDFYTNILGFTMQARDDGYAYIVKDEIALRLLMTTDTPPKGKQACYICVENLDDLFEQMKANLQQLPEGRVRAPFDQPYGQREFHVTDEDSLLLFFGEPVGT